MINITFIALGGIESIGEKAELIAAIEDIKAVFAHNLGSFSLISHQLPDEVSNALPENTRWMRSDSLKVFDPRTWVGKTDIFFLFQCGDWSQALPSPLLRFLAFIAPSVHLKGGKIVLLTNDIPPNLPIFGRRTLLKILKAIDLLLVGNARAIHTMKTLGIRREAHSTIESMVLFPQPSFQRREKILADMHIKSDEAPLGFISVKELFRANRFTQITKDVLLPQKYMPQNSAMKNRQRYIEQVARFADEFIERMDGFLVLGVVSPVDEPISKEIQAVMQKRHRVRFLSAKDAPVERFCAVIAASRFQLTSRYATIPLGAPYGTPILALSRDNDLEMIMREMGLTDFMLDYVASEKSAPNFFNLDERLMQLTLRAIENEESLRSCIMRTHETLQTRATYKRSLLANWLSRNFPGENQAAL